MAERLSSSEQSASHVRVNARLSLYLSIPGGVAVKALRGSDYEDVVLGKEPDTDREAIGERLDEWVAENFAELLDYVSIDAEAEVDW